MNHCKKFLLASFAFTALSAWSQTQADVTPTISSTDIWETTTVPQEQATPESAPATENTPAAETAPAAANNVSVNTEATPQADTPAATAPASVEEAAPVANVTEEQSSTVADTTQVPVALEQTAEPAAPAPQMDAATSEPPKVSADTSGMFTPDTAFNQWTQDKNNAYAELDQDSRSRETENNKPIITRRAEESPAETVDSTKAAERIDTRETPRATHVLDMLHGNAYNLSANEAAAPTVTGEIDMPHKMHGRNFAYVEPVESYGAVSFGESTTYFLEFDNNGQDMQGVSDMGVITAGFARSGFGASLSAAVGKSWKYIDDDVSQADSTEKSTTSGTYLGGAISANVRGLNLLAKVAYMYPETNTFISGSNEETEYENWDLAGKLTLAKSHNNTFAWAFNLNVLRHYAKKRLESTSIFEDNGKTYISTYHSSTTDTTSRIEIIPEFNMGKAVLQNPKARLFLGLNTAIPLAAYDRIDGIISRHNEYGLVLTPNALAEVALGQHVVAFGDISYRWDVVEYRDSYISSISIKSMETSSGSTTASLGMRLQCEYAALEMSFTQQFLQNPFGSFSDHDKIAMSIGAFVNF